MARIYLFLLTQLPVLIFPRIVIKTSGDVDYESFSEIELSYKFDLINSDNIIGGYEVSFTQWKFLIDECKASYANSFCNPWQPRKVHDVCHLISNNTVECSPLYIKRREERNFRFIGKLSDTLIITSQEQYTYRNTKCYCSDGFQFNPHLSKTADPVNGKMLVRTKPYGGTDGIRYFYIRSVTVNKTNYSSKSSTVITTESYFFER